MTEIKVKVIGSGTVSQHSVGGGRYMQLKAIPDYGAKFIRWEKFDQLQGGSPTFSSTNLCNVNTRYTSDVVAVFSNEKADEIQHNESMLKLHADKFAVANEDVGFWIDDPSVKVVKEFDAYGGLIVNDDGTVLDQFTALMWTYKTYPQKITMEKAMLLEKEFAGYSDWRIPTLSELETIIPTFNGFFSTKLIGYYWSTSSNKYHLHRKTVMDSHGREESKDPAKNYELLRLVRDIKKHSVNVQTIGLGSGAVKNMIVFEKPDGVIGKIPRFNNVYPHNTQIEFVATPNKGSRFSRWSGDASGSTPNFTTVISGPMVVLAEFEQITHTLDLQTQGSGEGSITPNTKEERHPHDTTVTLQAIADEGSKFKQWFGDIGGTATQVTIKMDGPKTVTAEFVRVYSLTVSTLGKGQVKRSELANEYEAGSTVTLTAIPEEGHEFVLWHEEAFSSNPVFTVVMNSSCTVLVEFRPLPVFDLKVTYAGTGSGVVLPNKQAFWQGSEVELIAQAAEGCVFDGWSGDFAEGLEENRKVTVNTHLAVTATFNRVEVPETDIGVVFDGTTYGDTQIGNATVFLFTVSNRSDRQIQLDIPLAGFVSLAGEEIEQATWVKGMIDGEKGATLRAGTFRKMGMAFDRRQLAKVALGEHLHITMLQSKPAQRLTFTFRCTNADKQVLKLVKADVEYTEPLAVAQENSPESGGLAAQAELTARMQLLENSLQEALSRLNAPPAAAPKPADAPTQTLPEVLAWLCTQNSVPLAVLRQKLLPLGLLPSAVLDDVNERAFDVAGEPALDEAAGTVTVQRRILLQVLTVL
jgi:hypothetical protein